MEQDWVVQRYEGAKKWVTIYRGTERGARCVRTRRKRASIESGTNKRFRAVPMSYAADPRFRDKVIGRRIDPEKVREVLLKVWEEGNATGAANK